MRAPSLLKLPLGALLAFGLAGAAGQWFAPRQEAGDLGEPLRGRSSTWFGPSSADKPQRDKSISLGEAETDASTSGTWFGPTSEQQKADNLGEAQDAGEWFAPGPTSELNDIGEGETTPESEVQALKADHLLGEGEQVEGTTRRGGGGSIASTTTAGDVDKNKAEAVTKGKGKKKKKKKKKKTAGAGIKGKGKMKADVDGKPAVGPIDTAAKLKTATDKLMAQLVRLEERVKSRGQGDPSGPDRIKLMAKIKRLQAVNVSDITVDEKAPSKSIHDLCEAFLVRTTSRATDYELKDACRDFIRPHEIANLPHDERTVDHLAPPQSVEVLTSVAKSRVKRAQEFEKTMVKDAQKAEENKASASAAAKVQKEEAGDANLAKSKAMNSTDTREATVLDEAVDIKRKEKEAGRLAVVVKKLNVKAATSMEIVKGEQKLFDNKYMARAAKTMKELKEAELRNEALKKAAESDQALNATATAIKGKGKKGKGKKVSNTTAAGDTESWL